MTKEKLMEAGMAKFKPMFDDEPKMLARFLALMVAELTTCLEENGVTTSAKAGGDAAILAANKFVEAIDLVASIPNDWPDELKNVAKEVSAACLALAACDAIKKLL